MAYDEGHAELIRSDFRDLGPVEKRMFGGLCFMLDGNMVCGVHKGGGLFRVGQDMEAIALALPGVGPMEMTGRRMKNFIEADEEAITNDEIRGVLFRMALAYAQSLPPK